MAAGARIRVLQGSGREARLRDACLARGSFVDGAGRSMVEYRCGLWKYVLVRALAATYAALAGVVLPEVQLHQLQRWELGLRQRALWC